MKRMAMVLVLPAILFAQDGKRRVRSTAEVTLRLIEATSTAGAANDAADLVPAELKTLLRFTRYKLLDSAFVRGVDSEQMRVALAGNLSGRVRFEVRSRQPEPILEFDVEITAPAAAQPEATGSKNGDRATRLLETTTTAKSGETVVLGASRMRDSPNALIVLLTCKLLP